ncbi:MAG: 50S ribosomal protein L22 [Candidatus Kapaibacterium sp.]
MEARALKKYIRSSPRKMRLVIDMIRGRKLEDAYDILRFSTQHAARDAEKVLRSAASNLGNKVTEEGNSLSEENVYVKSAWVNCGPTMKRIQPAPMGRAYRIRKRSNHLTIIVATDEENN